MPLEAPVMITTGEVSVPLKMLLRIGRLSRDPYVAGQTRRGRSPMLRQIPCPGGFVNANTHVLVVEDDRATRALLGVLLEHRKLRVSLAADGATALERLRAGDVDLLVLDLLLPRVNGFEVLRDLKCNHAAMLGRTIVVTAASERTLAGCAELREVWRIFRKPIDVEDFGSAVLACASARLRR